MNTQISGKSNKETFAKWMLVLGCVFIFVFIISVGLGLFMISEPNRHYKRLQKMANTVFQAEQRYYAQHGRYTVNMEKLGVKLPNLTDERYNQGGYVYENGEKIETPETYNAHTSQQDSILVQVMGTGDDPQALNLPRVLEINVFAKFRDLRASYSISHYFGHKASATPTLFQCHVQILHDNSEKKIERDIRTGGKFCKRMGAQPTDNELLWLFPNPDGK